MINSELLSYIRSQIATGQTQEVITKNLVSQGWSAQDVQEAFRAMSTTPSISSSGVPSSATVASSGIAIKVIIVLIALAVLGGGTFAWFKFNGKSNEAVVPGDTSLPTQTPISIDKQITNSESNNVSNQQTVQSPSSINTNVTTQTPAKLDCNGNLFSVKDLEVAYNDSGMSVVLRPNQSTSTSVCNFAWTKGAKITNAGGIQFNMNTDYDNAVCNSPSLAKHITGYSNLGIGDKSSCIVNMGGASFLYFTKKDIGAGILVPVSLGSPFLPLYNQTVKLAKIIAERL